MPMTAEDLYFELGRLVAETPVLESGPITPEINQWLKRAVALVQASGSLADAIQLTVAVQHLLGAQRPRQAETIIDIVHRSLARVGLNAPPSVQGAVIVVDETFDAYLAVRKVLGTASSDVLLVDPGAGAKVLTDYAVLAPETVTVRLLVDEDGHERSLPLALARWAQQLGRYRTLAVRSAPANMLHEQLILVDDANVWVLRQPFRELARKAQTSLVRARPETAARKVAAYAEIWADARPVGR
jgi:hypothetical protein